MFLGAASLVAGNGGIARLARLTARAMLAAGLDVQMLSYLDTMPLEIAGRSAQVCRGNKLSFLAGTHLAALRHRRCFYDSVGVARAHPRIPGLRRPYGLWMCGIEVWNELQTHKTRTLADAALPLAISRYTINRYQSLHGELPRANVCWLGTEEDQPPTRTPDFSGPPTALLVGRIDSAEQYSKGHRELVQCWPQVVAAVSDARLVIVGGGSGLEELRRLAGASEASAAIDIVGFVDEVEIENYWRRAHLFAMPSRGEGFGLTYIEAMRWGLPVIASVHDAGGEVNANGETGFNVSLDRPGELGDCIAGLLGNADRCRLLGQNAQARWQNHFSFSAFRRRFDPILDEFCESAD